MGIRIVRLGDPRKRNEGLRIGTVRRPPRGVPRAEFASRDFYDVWLPELAPSENFWSSRPVKPRTTAPGMPSSADTGGRWPSLGHPGCSTF